VRSKVVGRGVILPIAKSEFITTSKLAGENAGSGLPALIPPGMRAVSVRVNGHYFRLWFLFNPVREWMCC